ncbi:Nn.00g097690.m01.CDS01 [Neocucurbitaria sp. VM-36]
MANSRTVVNPFTKSGSGMRRNSRDSSWVTVDSQRSGIQRQAWPDKTVQPVTQDFQHVSQIPPLSQGPDESSTNTRTNFPPSLRTRGLCPVSPTFPNRVLRRDSPVSATEPIDFSRLADTKNGPDSSVSPYYPSSITKLKPTTKQSWWKQGLNRSATPPKPTSDENTASQKRANPSLIDRYRNAKDIYQVGPAGEGQKVWRGYKQFRKEKQSHAEVRQDIPTAEAHEPSRLAPQIPVETLPVHPPWRPLPGQIHTRHEARNSVPKSLHTRKDTGVSERILSHSSCEVPVAFDKTIRQVVDVNKPLPPIPLLQPAPKVRRPMDMESAFMVGIAAANMQQGTYTRVVPQPLKTDQNASKQNAQSTPWWKALADKQATKTSTALKSKISHRGPLMAFNDGQTANVATECGGVGGPAAAISLANKHKDTPFNKPSHMKEKQVNRPPPLNVSQRQKGKQKVRVDDTPPTHWRDMFDTFAISAGKSTMTGANKGRKRKDSDASFACQGLGGSEVGASAAGAGAGVRDPGPSRQVQMRAPGRFYADHEDLAPWPRVTVPRGVSDEARDTRFYQPYYEVLSEY